jgi:hypothetical protein
MVYKMIYFHSRAYFIIFPTEFFYLSPSSKNTPILKLVLAGIAKIILCYKYDLEMIKQNNMFELVFF